MYPAPGAFYGLRNPFYTEKCIEPISTSAVKADDNNTIRSNFLARLNFIVENNNIVIHLKHASKFVSGSKKARERGLMSSRGVRVIYSLGQKFYNFCVASF